MATPHIMSLWPPKYLVAEWQETSTPSLSGLKLIPADQVLSINVLILYFFATFTIAGTS